MPGELLVPVPTATEGAVAEPALNTPDVTVVVVPLKEIKLPLVKFAVVPVIVAPDTNEVNMPEAPLCVTKFAVVPVVVTPVSEVKEPEVNVAVVPAVVVPVRVVNVAVGAVTLPPEIVPVTVSAPEVE